MLTSPETNFCCGPSDQKTTAQIPCCGLATGEGNYCCRTRVPTRAPSKILQRSQSGEELCARATVRTSFITSPRNNGQADKLHQAFNVYPFLHFTAVFHGGYSVALLLRTVTMMRPKKVYSLLCQYYSLFRLFPLLADCREAVRVHLQPEVDPP